MCELTGAWVLEWGARLQASPANVAYLSPAGGSFGAGSQPRPALALPKDMPNRPIALTLVRAGGTARWQGRARRCEALCSIGN